MNEVSSHKDITSLTGIRGVAALYVVVDHFSGVTRFGGVRDTFIIHGYLSVDLFFVLSGFVMALTYQHMFRQDFSAATFLKFLGRRIARIYPIYFITTVAALVMILMGLRLNISASSSSDAGWALKFVLNCLLVQNWGLTGSLNSPAWSLSAEWAAYILFPLLLIPCVFRKANSAWMVFFLAVIVLAVLCILPLPDRRPKGLLDIANHKYGLSVIRCLPEFCLGLLSFRVSSTSFGRSLRNSQFISPIICVTIFVLLLVPKSDFFAVLLFPPLIISLASGSKHIPGRLLSLPLANLLGKLSYSVYLIHNLCTDIIPLVDRRVTRLGIHHGHSIAICAAMVTSFILAYISYKYIEVPGRRFFRGIFEGANLTSDRLKISLPSAD